MRFPVISVLVLRPESWFRFRLRFFQVYDRILGREMSQNNSWELFPDKWFKKMSIEEVKEAQQQIRTYAISKELDQGLSDVSWFFVCVKSAQAMIAVI